ncbi:MAG: hypothetical protein EP330_11305 [Deltaproteobacteria bacterium]|nr:MAG: hypothetical protein EP330_11305 [Deltaproteobacteria bacterium]
MNRCLPLIALLTACGTSADVSGTYTWRADVPVGFTARDADFRDEVPSLMAHAWVQGLDIHALRAASGDQDWEGMRAELGDPTELAVFVDALERSLGCTRVSADLHPNTTAPMARVAEALTAATELAASDGDVDEAVRLGKIAMVLDQDLVLNGSFGALRGLGEGRYVAEQLTVLAPSMSAAERASLARFVDGLAHRAPGVRDALRADLAERDVSEARIARHVGASERALDLAICGRSTRTAVLDDLEWAADGFGEDRLRAYRALRLAYADSLTPGVCWAGAVKLTRLVTLEEMAAEQALGDLRVALALDPDVPCPASMDGVVPGLLDPMTGEPVRWDAETCEVAWTLVPS